MPVGQHRARDWRAYWRQAAKRTEDQAALIGFYLHAHYRHGGDAPELEKAVRRLDRLVRLRDAVTERYLWGR